MGDVQSPMAIGDERPRWRTTLLLGLLALTASDGTAGDGTAGDGPSLNSPEGRQHEQDSENRRR